MESWGGLCFKAITSSSRRFNNSSRSRLFLKWIFKWPVSSGSTWVNCSFAARLNEIAIILLGPGFTRRPDPRAWARARALSPRPKTTLTLFCPRVQSRRQRSTVIRSSTSKAGATSIWPASCCKRRNRHPSSIGEFERSPLTIARIEFVSRVFRHSWVSRNPNLQWPPFERNLFYRKISARLPVKRIFDEVNLRWS